MKVSTLILVILVNLVVQSGIAVMFPARPQVDPPVDTDPDCAGGLTARLTESDERAGARVDVRVLGCDPRGRGRAIVAIGDPSTARHVAVLVPGSDADLATLADPAEDAAREARRPWAGTRALAAAAGPGTAVVLWIGYRTPVGVGLAAATGGAARAGAPALVRDVARLADRPHRPHVTVIGHSYGAVVVALAARQLAADDIVLLASPGARAPDVTALGARARVYAARFADDWINRVPSLRIGDLGHGADPAAPAFGARPLAVGNTGGHDGYLLPGSASLVAVARVVTNSDITGSDIEEGEKRGPAALDAR